MPATIERIVHKHNLGDTVTIYGMWRAKITKLDHFYSERTECMIPFYLVKQFLGNTNHLNQDEVKVYEHQISVITL